MPLKALILVGGYGTRLRPLTFSKPKPLCEFVNKPVVVHQIEALVEAGVKEIIFAVCFKPEALEKELSVVAKKLGIKIYFTLEKEPLGTAGCIKLNEKLLDPNDPDPFFMCNADVIANYQFKLLLEFHQKHKKEGTIYVTPVDDPTRYGVVVANNNGKISSFVEKPKDKRFGNLINAGLYIFNKDIIKRVPPRKTSIEREIFPKMAKSGNLYRFKLESIWMDVGKPGDFIVGQELYLRYISKLGDKRIMKPDYRTFKDMVVVDPTAKISRKAVIGPNVVIGPGVIIGDNVRVKNSCIMAGCLLNDGCFVSGSLIGWKSKIGKWSRLQDLCILGEDVEVRSELFLRGTTVCPHKDVKESQYQVGKVIL